MKIIPVVYREKTVKEVLNELSLSWDDVAIHGENARKKVYLSFFDLVNSRPSSGTIVVFSTKYKLSCISVVDGKLSISRVLKNLNAFKRYRNSLQSDVKCRVKTYLYALEEDLDFIDEEERICRMLSKGKRPKPRKCIPEAVDLLRGISLDFSPRDLSYMKGILSYENF